MSQACLILLAGALVASPAAAQLTANPSALTFTFAGGGRAPAPPPQPIDISSGGAAVTLTGATITSCPNCTGVFTPTLGVKGRVNVGFLNPPALFQLAAGTYTGTLHVTTGLAAPNDAIDITLTLVVGVTSGTGLVTASPSSLNFAATSGSFAPGQVVALNSTTGTPISFTFSTSTTTGQSWLLVQTNSNTTPATMTVFANAAGLGNGSFSGTISILAGGTTTTIPVTFVVGGGGSLIVSPGQLSFAFAIGSGTPLPQTLSVSSAVATSVTAQASSSGSWLLVDGGSFTSRVLPTAISVSVNPAGLSAGTFSGSISLTGSDGSSQTVPVILTVSSSTSLVVSPSSMLFFAQTGGTAPAQTLQISSGTSGLSFTASPFSDTGWLSVSTTSGTVPGTITVFANSGSLAAGTYTGSITITATGSITASQVVPVTLTVGTATTGSPVANPTSLTFAFQSGSSAAVPPQTVVVSGASGFSFTATPTTTSGGSWLAVNGSTSAVTGSTPSNLDVRVNTAGLAVGTYSGSINVSSSIGTQAVTVTLIISSNAVVVANPGTIVLNYQLGTQVPSPINLILTSSDSTATGFTFTASPNVAWLQVTPSSGTTSAILGVQLNPASLSAGTFTGSITVTAPGAANTPMVVPVVATITAGSGLTPLTLSTNVVAFAASPGANPAAQSITVSAATATSFTATASTSSGGNWLLVNGLTVTTGITPTAVSVTANSASLAAGTYTGTISFTANGVSQAVTVTLVVGTGVGGVSGSVSLDISSLAFDFQQGGATPNPKSVQVTTSPAGVGFTATATTSTGSWLSVVPATGTGNTALTVSVNPAGLATGSYNGTVTVTPVGGSAQSVNVTLTVRPQSALTASASSLSFAFRTNESAPAAQTIDVSSTGAAVAFAASATSTGWLVVSPTSGTTPARLVVSINTGGLTNGTLNGSIAISSTSAGATSTTTIPVTLVVSGPLPTITKVANAASFQEGAVSPGEVVSISGTFIGPNDLATLKVDNGVVASNLADVQVLFNGVPAPIIFVSSTQVAAIAPYALAGRSTAIVQVAFHGIRSNALTVPVAATAPGIFTLNASGTGPGAILNQDGTVNSINNGESRGRVVSIYATGEGQTIPGGVDGRINSGTTLPAPVLGVTATIDGRPAEVLYAGAAPGLVAGVIQVNLRVPDGVSSGSVPVAITIGSNSSQLGVTVTVR